MGAHYFQNGDCRGIIHLADIYRYGGFTFEFHRYCGPVRCRKNLEPFKRQPGVRSRFWPVFERWHTLTKQQKEKTRIYG